jgi:hypothetical protein
LFRGYAYLFCNRPKEALRDFDQFLSATEASRAATVECAICKSLAYRLLNDESAAAKTLQTASERVNVKGRYSAIISLLRHNISEHLLLKV